MNKTIILITLSVLILISFVYYPLRSYIIMKALTGYENSCSVMKENGFRIKMDSGKQWYPFVITFNALGFGKYSGTDAKMSIMYNFGKFYDRKSSLVYNKSSPYYSAFYGAYILSMNNEVYGFNNGKVMTEDLINAFKYDYCKLVLQSIGCQNPQFNVTEYKITENISYLGYDNWTMIEALIITNGMAHNYKTKQRSYIQYGIPSGAYNTDFKIENFYGRLYARYFEEYNSTIVIYVMAQDMDTIDSCNKNILSKTRIIDR